MRCLFAFPKQWNNQNYYRIHFPFRLTGTMPPLRPGYTPQWCDRTKGWEFTSYLTCPQLIKWKTHSISFLVIRSMAIKKKKLPSATKVVSVLCINFNTKTKAQISNIYLQKLHETTICEGTRAPFPHHFSHSHLCYLWQGR